MLCTAVRTSNFVFCNKNVNYFLQKSFLRNVTTKIKTNFSRALFTMPEELHKHDS